MAFVANFASVHLKECDHTVGTDFDESSIPLSQQISHGVEFLLPVASASVRVTVNAECLGLFFDDAFSPRNVFLA